MKKPLTPEQAWPLLETFLGKYQQRLKPAEAIHIKKAFDAGEPGWALVGLEAIDFDPGDEQKYQEFVKIFPS